MNPILYHLYGPLNINSYGVMIALGVILFTWRCLKTKPQWLSSDQFYAAITRGILGGVIGGRLLNWLTNPEHFSSFFDLFKLWLGGFSVLGAAMGILIAILLFCAQNKLSFLALMDLFALNAGILQSISRLGCFLAGCCYGLQTSLPWGITYTHEASMAPLCMPLHPVQLYSAFLFFMAYCTMQLIAPYFKKNGQLLMIYLMLFGVIRFSLDFLRGDRSFASGISIFSIDQLIALSILLSAFFCFMFLLLKNNNDNKPL
jgi:phosphatidylglycerol:prolipoprotein diacylglycerol transferase